MEREMSITIKPTLACNMKCRHCFNGDLAKNNRIHSIEEACKFLMLVAEKYKDIAVTFHGGEPTLAGYEYYNAIFNMQEKLSKEKNVHFHNSITTNGLLLDNTKLVELFIYNDVLFNVSFDGPYNYVLREHSDNVYLNIKNIQNKGGKIRIYCIISEESHEHIIEIYEWFKKEKLDFKLIPVRPVGIAEINSDIIMDKKSFVNRLMEAYIYWLEDKEKLIHCFTFEEFVTLKNEVQFKDYWFFRKLALNPDGKIYPFGRPNDINYSLGHVMNIHSIMECYKKEKYKKLLEDLQEMKREFCKNCTSKTVCGGVTLFSTFVYGDDIHMLRYSCELSNMIFQNIIKINKNYKL